MFQNLEQAVSDLGKGSVPEFFYIILNLRQLELTPPPHLFSTPLRLYVPFYVSVHVEDGICISFYVKQ